MSAADTEKPLTVLVEQSRSVPVLSSSPRSTNSVVPPSPSSSGLPPPSTLDNLASDSRAASAMMLPQPTMAILPVISLDDDDDYLPSPAASSGQSDSDAHSRHNSLLDELSDAARETAARALHDQKCFLDDTEVAAFPYRTMEALFPTVYPPPKSFKPKNAKAALRRGLYPTQRLVIYERIFYQMSKGRLPVYQTAYSAWFNNLCTRFPILPHTPMEGILPSIPLFGADDWRTKQHIFLADHNSTIEHLHAVKVPQSLLYAAERVLFVLSNSLPHIDYCPPIASLTVIFLLLGASEPTTYSFVFALLSYNHIKQRAASVESEPPSMLARASPRAFHSSTSATVSPRSANSSSSSSAASRRSPTSQSATAAAAAASTGASGSPRGSMEDEEDGDESYLPQSKESYEHLLGYLSAYILKQEKSSQWLFELMGLADIEKKILRPYFEDFFLSYLPLGTIVRFIDCWLMKGEKLFLRALWAIIRLHAKTFAQRFKAKQGQFSPDAFKLLSAQMAAEPLLKETFSVWLSTRQMNEISKLVKARHSPSVPLAPMISPTPLMDQKLWLYLWGHLPASLSSLKAKNIFNTTASSPISATDYSRFFSTSSSQAFRGIILLIGVHFRSVSGVEESKESDAVVGAVLPFKNGVDNPFGFKLGKETKPAAVEIDSSAFLFESVPQRNIFSHVAAKVATENDGKESKDAADKDSAKDKEPARRFPLQLLLNAQQTALVDESATLVLHFGSTLDRVVSSGTAAFGLPVPLFKNAVAGHGVVGSVDEFDDGKCLWAVKDGELRKQVNEVMLGGESPKTAAASSAAIHALECWSFH